MVKYNKYLIITIITLSIIFLFSCNRDNNNDVYVPIQLDDSYVLNVNSNYDAGSVQLGISEIEFYNSSNENISGIIIIYGKFSILEDQTYWSPENSTIIINDSDEYTIPFLFESIDQPLYLVEDKEIILTAYVTEVDIDSIEKLVWNIQDPVIEIKDGEFKSNGKELNLIFTIKRE